jgi:hypothetical protein
MSYLIIVGNVLIDRHLLHISERWSFQIGEKVMSAMGLFLQKYLSIHLNWYIT